MSFLRSLVSLLWGKFSQSIQSSQLLFENTSVLEPKGGIQLESLCLVNSSEDKTVLEKLKKAHPQGFAFSSREELYFYISEDTKNIKNRSHPGKNKKPLILLGDNYLDMDSQGTLCFFFIGDEKNKSLRAVYLKCEYNVYGKLSIEKIVWDPSLHSQTMSSDTRIVVRLWL